MSASTENQQTQGELTGSPVDRHLSAFENNRRNANIEDARLAHIEASEEWADVATIIPSIEGHSNNAKDAIQTSLSISVNEAFEYFKCVDLAASLSNMTPVVERKGFCSMLSCFLGPPQLRDNLNSERDLIFAITKCDFNANDAIHWRMLQTVYKQFTGDVFDCPRFGSHWQYIGFQGSDPGTDFRGVGILGLLHLLYLTTTSELKALAQHLHRTSVDERQNFPLAVLSLNMTSIALKSLRHGELNGECNRQRQVLSAFDEFYAAVLFRFLSIYSSQNKTIKDTGYLLKDVESYCRSNVRAALRNLRNNVNAERGANGDSLSLNAASFHDKNLAS